MSSPTTGMIELLERLRWVEQNEHRLRRARIAFEAFAQERSVDLWRCRRAGLIDAFGRLPKARPNG